ncbi:uncharacterized protein Z518_06028 [Rhinocladiella mackenziei CBS 650.93]|uniref:Uncharacterized protein n=1 Tax=Rhinocladiella mackenziei CBS 650.93 TaxID=1442369 RepID=A0A0D2IPR1_9EURO|nr:uncharacterized protein Z518_06028 [Rhinocladiella mackenziei CBS 650.93]KIX05156.1 hypothetical protein Z518_06028 [Rhinocladiella mackenziei CBS 650.93]
MVTVSRPVAQGTFEEYYQLFNTTNDTTQMRILKNYLHPAVAPDLSFHGFQEKFQHATKQEQREIHRRVYSKLIPSPYRPRSAYTKENLILLVHPTRAGEEMKCYLLPGALFQGGVGYRINCYEFLEAVYQGVRVDGMIRVIRRLIDYYDFLIPQTDDQRLDKGALQDLAWATLGVLGPIFGPMLRRQSKILDKSCFIRQYYMDLYMTNLLGEKVTVQHRADKTIPVLLRIGVDNYDNILTHETTGILWDWYPDWDNLIGTMYVKDENGAPHAFEIDDLTMDWNPEVLTPVDGPKWVVVPRWSKIRSRSNSNSNNNITATKNVNTDVAAGVTADIKADKVMNLGTENDADTETVNNNGVPLVAIDQSRRQNNSNNNNHQHNQELPSLDQTEAARTFLPVPSPYFNHDGQDTAMPRPTPEPYVHVKFPMLAGDADPHYPDDDDYDDEMVEVEYDQEQDPTPSEKDSEQEGFDQSQSQEQQAHPPPWPHYSDQQQQQQQQQQPQTEVYRLTQPLLQRNQYTIELPEGVRIVVYFSKSGSRSRSRSRSG